MMFDVETVLKRRNELRGKRIVLKGALQVHYFGPIALRNGKARVVQDQSVRWNSGNAILVLRNGLLKLLEKEIGFRYGGLPFNDPVELSGVLTESADPDFLAAVAEIGKFRFESDSDVLERDFSKENE